MLPETLGHDHLSGLREAVGGGNSYSTKAIIRIDILFVC